MATVASFGPQGGLPQWPVLASGPCNWVIKEGTTPTIEQFQVTPDTASAMWNHAKDNKPFTLFLSCEGESLKVEFLYMIGRAAGPNEYVKAVAIADRRWFWSYAWMGPRRFNWRRRIGVKRPEEFNAPATIATPVLPEVWYAPWSLKQKADPNPLSSPPNPDSSTDGVWKARDLMEEIFKTVFQIEKVTTGNEPKVIWRIPRPKASLPLENVVIDTAGDDAIANGLNYLPEHNVYIHPNGDVIVKNKTFGSEKYLALKGDRGGYEKVGKGHAELINNALVRPRRIHVLFTREVEVRFDFWEKFSYVSGGGFGFAANIGANQLELHKARMMYNVLPVPDWLLPHTTPPKVMGTWVTFDEALAVWNQSIVNDLAEEGVKLNLDYPLIRKAMVPFLDLWAGFRLLGLYHPNNDWMGRIGAIQAHYRRTFMINQTWLNRIQQMKSYRQACVDPENGARSPALVLANHTRLASQKSMRIDALKGAKGWDGVINLAMPVLSYPAINDADADEPPPCLAGEENDPANRYPITESKIPGYGTGVGGGGTGIVHAPATLQIEDSDQGILSIDFKADPYRTYEQVLPGLMRLENATGPGTADSIPPTQDSGPSADPTHLDKPIAFNMLSTVDLRVPALSPRHKVATIFTCIPASTSHHIDTEDPYSPIVNQQLEDVTIFADDIELSKMVSTGVKESLTDAYGPDMYIRISAANEVARIEWRDEKYQEIEKIFGFRDGKPDTTGLVLNMWEIPGYGPEYGASLNRIALSSAARVYSSLVDRYQGDKTSPLRPEAVPDGWVGQVAHTVSANGEASTRIDFPEQIPQLDMISYLDSGTRELLLKLARPGE